MSKLPVFHLTRRAALDLSDIYDRSMREWGESTADRYVADLYDAMSKAAANPDTGGAKTACSTFLNGSC